MIEHTEDEGWIKDKCSSFVNVCMVHGVCRHVQHMHVCGNQRIIGVFLYVGSFTEPKAHLGQATNHQPGTYLSLPSWAGVLGPYILAWLFTCLGLELRSSCLQRKHSCQLSPFPHHKGLPGVLWDTHNLLPQPTMDQNMNIIKM